MRSTDTENCLCFSPNDDYFVRVHGIGGIPTTLKGEPDQIGVCMVRTDRQRDRGDLLSQFGIRDATTAMT